MKLSNFSKTAFAFLVSMLVWIEVMFALGPPQVIEASLPADIETEVNYELKFQTQDSYVESFSASDLLFFVQSYGSSECPFLRWDLNDDGSVNAPDLMTVISMVGQPQPITYTLLFSTSDVMNVSGGGLFSDSNVLVSSDGSSIPITFGVFSERASPCFNTTWEDGSVIDCSFTNGSISLSGGGRISRLD